MADPVRYKKSADLLLQKVKTKDAQKKGFRRFTKAEIGKIVEQAGDPAIANAEAERNLRAALSEKGVLTYTPWKDGVPKAKRHYLLYHHGGAMAKIMDVIVNHGKDNDQKLGKVVNAAESGKKINLKGVLG